MSLWPWNRDDKRVVAHARVGSTPWRQVGQRVGPTDSNYAGISRLPAIAAASHPVIGIRQGYAADPVFTGKCNRPFHTVPGIQITRTDFPVPSFHCCETCQQCRFDVNINEAALNHGEETRKAVQAVRVDAISVGFGKKLSAALGAPWLESDLQQHA